VRAQDQQIDFLIPDEIEVGPSDPRNHAQPIRPVAPSGRAQGELRPANRVKNMEYSAIPASNDQSVLHGPVRRWREVGCNCKVFDHDAVIQFLEHRRASSQAGIRLHLHLLARTVLH
jgi:hypothetical protein